MICVLNNINFFAESAKTKSHFICSIQKKFCVDDTLLLLTTRSRKYCSNKLKSNEFILFK